jgi:hypothetical protein
MINAKEIAVANPVLEGQSLTVTGTEGLTPIRTVDRNLSRFVSSFGVLNAHRCHRIAVIGGK